jgi:hypothetical protein
MTHDDVSDGEMPHLPFARQHGEPTPTDALLSPRSSGAVPDEWQAVSEVLQAAAGPATASELVGEAATVAAFRRAQHGAARGAVPALRRLLVRPTMLTTLLSGKLAATLAAAAVSATGVATAAYAGALPDGAQNLAHHLIAAPPAWSNASDTGQQHGHQFASTSDSSSPAETSTDTTSSTQTTDSTETLTADETTSESATPSPTGDQHAAFGLCTAWSNAVTHGLTGQVGFKDKLAALAGVGADASADPTATQTADPSESIDAFCATVQHPGAQKSEDPQDSDSVEPMEKPAPSMKPLHPSKVTGPNGDHGKSGQSHGNNGQGDS